ncbi:unnamed protein product [Cylindrotheca closterium]|uniref:Cyclin-like domain-containing protein n=1 Tax=Cylindrotheca closterium TaxID=2856 RepID=A0AAD2PXT8_9STRA|nr:unnamed protein product [Cylindrotheca closterium]
MCEPKESSQLKSWIFTPENLELCRARANRVARKLLSDPAANNTPPPVQCFARDFDASKYPEDQEEGPLELKGSPFLNPEEEALIVNFYVSKLPTLMGPQAQVSRLRRESKIPATAAMLLRRFFLSNSVMMFDPKAIMVASAFLASKVEDAMTDIRYLEEGTQRMNAPVTQAEILPAEIDLLSGINFELLCFHPYKAVLAITEDLRTYLKSEQGKSLVHFSDGNQRPITGHDLKPMHDAAQLIVNDVIVSDIPMLYTPAQIGLASMVVANEEQQSKPDIPQIDLKGYLAQRFEEADQKSMTQLLDNICVMLRGLKDGKYGCGNHKVDMQVLKGIHKKLKKCRLWGAKEKKKKRKKDAAAEGSESDKKRTKTS